MVTFPLSPLFTLISIGIFFSIYAILCLRCTFWNMTLHINDKALYLLILFKYFIYVWSLPWVHSWLNLYVCTVLLYTMASAPRIDLLLVSTYQFKLPQEEIQQSLFLFVLNLRDVLFHIFTHHHSIKDISLHEAKDHHDWELSRLIVVKGKECMMIETLTGWYDI